MAEDFLDSCGFLTLGSRFRRIAERLQSDAGLAHKRAGFPMQPSQCALLIVLYEKGPMNVGDAAELLYTSQPGITRTNNSLMEMGWTTADADLDDQRIKVIRLTDEGQKNVEQMHRELWPSITEAVRKLCDGPLEEMLNHLSLLEERLNKAPLIDRIEQERTSFNTCVNTSSSKQIKRSALKPDELQILDYNDELASEFESITREWVEGMFELEPKDLEIIQNPRKMILDKGGVILFVATQSLGVIGTGALMPVYEGCFELTKMGVRESARGLGAGDFLLKKLLDRAKELSVDELFLLTNRKCQAAIHLYEKVGFKHDNRLLDRFGSSYTRCDVGMTYEL